MESLLIALRRAERHKDVWDTLALAQQKPAPQAVRFFSTCSGGLRRKLIARLGAEAGDVVDGFELLLAAERGVAARRWSLLDRGGPEVKREMDQTRGEVAS